MKKEILVTGGAGFIGSHLVDALIRHGYGVRVLDNLDPQVHGKSKKVPRFLNPRAEFIYGDIRDVRAVGKALKGIEAVFHLASKVGTGQSMYNILDYVGNNTYGTANILEAITRKAGRIKKLIVASSMSLYGEGQYQCARCGSAYPGLRTVKQLIRRIWELKCSLCHRELTPMPTDEGKPLYPASIYAINKRDQEEMCLSVGRAYNIPAVALRYFNVYGPRQALDNPYTGVAAIFSNSLLSNTAPTIFEDGGQSRDFIHINDVIQANILALESDAANYQVFNVGTGKRISILAIANILAEKFKAGTKPKIVNKFRAGDIRHCYADISKIRRALKFKPKIRFEDGIDDLINWVSMQKTIDRSPCAIKELEARGLIR